MSTKTNRPSLASYASAQQQAAKKPKKKKDTGARPRPPAGLRPDARREWTRICVELDIRGDQDSPTMCLLRHLATTQAAMNHAQAVIDDEGLTVASARGAVTTHPAVGIRDRARRDILSILTKLGMTPVSQAKAKRRPSGDLLDG